MEKFWFCFIRVRVGRPFTGGKAAVQRQTRKRLVLRMCMEGL